MKGPRRARMPVYGAGSKYLGRTEKETEWLRFHAPCPPAIPTAPLQLVSIPSESDGHLRICYLLPTHRETTSDFYARRGLTSSERRVATLLLLGMTNRAIASSLGRSVETIHRHVSKILRKCEVSNRSSFVASALGGPARR
jgi:DNA-binding CsgD family transcriptional regulator